MTLFNSSFVEQKERRLQDLLLKYRHEGQKTDVFREVFDLMYQDVYHFFYQRLPMRSRGQQVSEDLAQEVFLRVARSIDQFDASKKVGPWFWTIVRNRLIDEYRKPPEVSAAEMSGSSVFAEVDFRDPESELLDRIVQQTEDTLLQTVMDELSEIQREILQLRIWSEMSYADIGTTMELSENSIKSHLKRVKQILLKKLKNQDSAHEG